jgi:ribosomal protein S15P/S13E
VGPEPEVEAAAPAASSEAEGGSAARVAIVAPVDQRARLTRYYEKYNPEKVPTVDAMLAKYVHSEEKLFESLVKKYGPEPAAADADESATAPLKVDQSFAIVEDGGDAAGAPSVDHRARLLRYYKKYNPTKLDTVAGTIQKYAGKEEMLFNALVKKYGPEPEE